MCACVYVCVCMCMCKCKSKCSVKDLNVSAKEGEHAVEDVLLDWGQSRAPCIGHEEDGVNFVDLVPEEVVDLADNSFILHWTTSVT